MNASEHKPVPRWQAGDWLVRLLVPAYVAAGALLKLTTGRPLELPLVSLNRDPSPEAEMFAGSIFPVVIAVELCLALLLALGPRWVRWVACVLLAVFVVILIPHVRAAGESCGCFGAVRTPPQLMMINAASFCLLTILLPFGGRPLLVVSGRVQAVLLAGAAVLAGTMWYGQVPERVGWRVAMMRLRPQTWVGKPLAELPFVPALQGQGPTAFGESVQTWVLWLRSCPHCHDYFRENWFYPSDDRVVAVEVPRSAAGIEPEPHRIDCGPCVRLHLRAGTYYYIPQTPVVLRVEAGKVVSVDVNPGGAEEAR